MSRFFILSVLICATLAITGCLSPGDDTISSGSISGGKVVAISPKVKLNKTTLGASIRAALNTSSAQLTLTLKDGTTVAMTAIADDGTTITYQTTAAVSLTSLTLSGTNYVLSVSAVINGVTIPLTVLIPTGLGATTSSGTTTDVTASITLTTDSSGKITYTYTLQYIPAGQTTVVNTGTTQPPSGTIPIPLPDFYLEKVAYLNGSTETVLGQVETSISYSTPVFKIYFSKAISSIPSILSANFKSSTKTITFTTNGVNQLSSSLDSSKRVLTVTVYGQTGTDKLAAGTSYDMSLTSGTISNETNTASTTLSASQIFKVKTAGSATTGFGIDKVALYNPATGGENQLSTISTNNMPFVQPVIRIYFTSAIAAVPTTFSMSAGSMASFTLSDQNAALSLSSDKKMLTVTISGQSDKAKLSPFTTYDLSFNSSTIYAEGSSSSTTSLNNGQFYRVTTKKTSLQSWDAQTSSSAGTWVSTRGTYVATNTTRIVLNFDYTTLIPTDISTSNDFKFTKTLNSTTVTGALKDFFNPITASGTSIYLQLGAGQALKAGTYSISYSSGNFFDAVYKPVDTTGTFTFVVQ